MKKLLGVLTVIAIIAIVAVPRVLNMQEKTGEADAVNVITVGGQAIETGELKAVVELVGSTAPDAMVSVMVGVPAEVTEVKAQVGDYVEEGDVLFSMDPSDIEDQVTQAELGVTMAKVGVDNARAGVSQASLAYTMAKSNYEMQMDSYEFGQSNLANYEQLLAQGVVSQMEYDQVKLQSSEETLTLLETQLDQASAALSQARLGVESANASLEQATEGLKTATEMLVDMTVTAPVSGYITASNVTVNNYASNAQPAMVIQNMDSITVSANVTETLVPSLSIGDEVEVTINALDGKTFKGSIETLSTAADQRTLLFPMTVKVDNKNHEIRPGMFATVDVVKAVSKNTLYVPSEAVILRDDIQYIYVMDGEDKAVRKEVTTGIDNGFFTEITAGAKEGDIIVTKGIGLIDENSVVKMIRSDQ